MNPDALRIQRNYIIMTLLNTLAASFIWGINTLFLLDAGLSNTEAFAANAFFTAGMVLFEVPTGIIADTFGRRVSYLLGSLTLSISTVLYLMLWQADGPFWMWSVVSILLGLGFTFFSGAVEAWLVDALKYAGYKGALDSVFAKGQIAGGIAMLTGSVAGGFVAQATNLGVPYILRAVILGVSFTFAYAMMKDLGFTPQRSKRPLQEMKRVLASSIDNGLRKRSIRWMMLSAPFTSGVGFYAFYAMQPYLLELYGNSQAYGIAGLAAASVAGAQILGGLSVPLIRKVFRKRTSILILGTSLNVVLLSMIGVIGNFWFVVGLLILWALIFALTLPVRQAYLNGLITSKERATVLSFDSLMGSSGGVFIQPALGKAADVWSYGTSYVIAATIQTLSLPFLYLARKEKPVADTITEVQKESEAIATETL